jgi:hypothetical protein
MNWDLRDREDSDRMADTTEANAHPLLERHLQWTPAVMAKADKTAHLRHVTHTLICSSQ